MITLFFVIFFITSPTTCRSLHPSEKLTFPLYSVAKNPLQNSNSNVVNGIELPLVNLVYQYTALVYFGSPLAVKQSLVIDTGSEITWIQCNPCINCYQQKYLIYTPENSGSYGTLPCESEECKKLLPENFGCNTEKDMCMYHEAYGDGSTTKGDFVTDVLTTVPVGLNKRILFGCGHDQAGIFYSESGIMGLSYGSLSFPTQIGARSFSFCLVRRWLTDSSTLEFNSEYLFDATVETFLIFNTFVPSSRPDIYRYIQLNGISIGGTPINVDPIVFSLNPPHGYYGVFLDTGTPYTYLPASVYQTFRDALLRLTTTPRIQGPLDLDTCFTRPWNIPQISFIFEYSQNLDLPADGILAPYLKDRIVIYCLAFVPSTKVETIIGNHQLQKMRININLQDSIMQFRPNSC